MSSTESNDLILYDKKKVSGGQLEPISKSLACRVVLLHESSGRDGMFCSFSPLGKKRVHAVVRAIKAIK